MTLRDDPTPLTAAGIPNAAPADSPIIAPLDWAAIWTLILSIAAIGASAAQIAGAPRTSGMFLPALAITVCLLAAWYDAASSRIPNQLTYTALLLGLTLNGIAPLLPFLRADIVERSLGAVGPGQAFLGFAVCAGIGLFALLLAGMGGGDLELLAALGAMMGLTRVTPILICSLAAAVLYAFLNLALRGKLNAVTGSAGLALLQLASLKRPDHPAPASGNHATIPLAVPLLIGLILARTLPASWLATWAGAA